MQSYRRTEYTLLQIQIIVSYTRAIINGTPELLVVWRDVDPCLHALDASRGPLGDWEQASAHRPQTGKLRLSINLVLIPRRSILFVLDSGAYLYM
jgi:hypothetical protein